MVAIEWNTATKAINDFHNIVQVCLGVIQTQTSRLYAADFPKSGDIAPYHHPAVDHRAGRTHVGTGKGADMPEDPPTAPALFGTVRFDHDL